MRQELGKAAAMIAQWRGISDKKKPQAAEDTVDNEPLNQEEVRRRLFIGEGNERRTFPATCRFCKGYMTPVDRIDGQTTMRLLPYLIVVMRWLAGKPVGPAEKQPCLLPIHFRQFVAAELEAEERRLLTAGEETAEPVLPAEPMIAACCRPPPESA